MPKKKNLYVADWSHKVKEKPDSFIEYLARRHVNSFACRGEGTGPASDLGRVRCARTMGFHSGSFLSHQTGTAANIRKIVERIV